MADTQSAMISAATTASQTPSSPRNIGRSITAPLWNTSVLRNEIMADTTPFPRAVKKAELQILKPQMIKNRA